MAGRLMISLDAEHGAALRRIAKRVGAEPPALAGVLLTQAIDQAGYEDADMTALLDAIPGAFEAAQAGLEDMRTGRAIRLEDL